MRGMNLADRASAFLNQGIREISGPTSHPQILAWLKRTEKLWPTDLPVDDSRYAWCGVFVGNMVLDDMAAGNTTRAQPPKYFQGAIKWATWGKTVTKKAAQRGDVVVLTRTGGHHVAIVSSINDNGVKVIGGNQGDALSVVEYPWTKVVAVRRG